MFKRKIISILLALSTTLSIANTAHAEDVIETKRTVKIGNYDCWSENGEYYTEINGEVGLVINLDELSSQSDTNQISLLSETMLDWEHGNVEFDLTDGKSYNGLITLKNNDDYTPIFRIVTEQSALSSLMFYTKFVLPNKYKITILTYNANTSEWNYAEPKTVTLSLAVRYFLIVSGTETRDITKCCV